MLSTNTVKTSAKHTNRSESINSIFSDALASVKIVWQPCDTTRTPAFHMTTRQSKFRSRS